MRYYVSKTALTFCIFLIFVKYGASLWDVILVLMLMLCKEAVEAKIMENEANSGKWKRLDK